MKKLLLLVASFAVTTLCMSQKVTSAAYPFKSTREYKMVLKVDNTDAAIKAITNYFKDENWNCLDKTLNGNGGMFSFFDLTSKEYEEYQSYKNQLIAEMKDSVASLDDSQENEDLKMILNSELAEIEQSVIPTFYTKLFVPAFRIKQFGFTGFAPPVNLYSFVYLRPTDDGKVEVLFTNFDAEILHSIGVNGGLDGYRSDADLTETDRLINQDRLGSSQGMSTSERRDLYNKGVRSGHWAWISNRNVFHYLSKRSYIKDNVVGYNVIVKQQRRFIEGDLVRELYNNMWVDIFQAFYDEFFKRFCDKTHGVIEGIYIDDVPVYTPDETGRILPVDKKERKKWIKEGRQF